MAARSEAARALAQFEYLDRYNLEADDEEREITAERRKSLADAGSRLVAFAHSNQFIVPILRKCKLFPQHAGNQLILLSQLSPFGDHNERVRRDTMRYLRLGRRF